MTKEQFLNETPFSLDYDYSSGATYVYNNPNGRDKGSLSREYRTKEGKIVLSDHLMNIDKIGRKMITAYCFIIGRKIVERIRYEDMIEFPEQDNI
jgi:hypothetical protein